MSESNHVTSESMRENWPIKLCLNHNTANIDFEYIYFGFSLSYDLDPIETVCYFTTEEKNEEK